MSIISVHISQTKTRQLYGLMSFLEDDEDPFRSYRDAAAKNTDNTVNGFDKLLHSVMETEPVEEQKEQRKIEEDHLSNCWKTPPRLVYSRFLTGQSHSSTTQQSTLSGITDSNTSPDGATTKQ
eukprot:8907060-Ditylum_brightwellii.AAC.1